MTIAIQPGDGAISNPTTRATPTVVRSLPGIAVAAVTSIGAGVVHAGAIGIHAEHAGLARLFIILAVFQIGWGLIALVHPSRWLAAIGVAGNLAAVGAWLTTRLVGISFIGGLETREAAQFSDTACALLGLGAAGIALAAALIGWRSAPGHRLLFPCLAVAVLTIPALVTGSTHLHSHATSTAGGESAAHDHNVEGARGGASAATIGNEASTAGAGAAIGNESTSHVHNADRAATVTAGAAITPVVDKSQAHVHTAAAVPTVPYDPTLPIDLGGVAGVTPHEQARAENLVAITLIRLPQWSDPATAVAAGFQSIGDAATGFEHYIQWNWINDSDYLDPDHPESLVYIPQPDGTKKLVSAMFMLPDTMTLDQVPDIGGALTQWHIHDNLCFTRDLVAPKVAGIVDSSGGCPASLQKFRPAPMIHVWITPNKCGPFAALEGVGAGQVQAGQVRACDDVHGAGAGLGG